MSGRATWRAFLPPARPFTRTFRAAATPALALFLCVAGFDRVSCAPPADDAAGEAVDSPEDFAGVYLDRYVPADEKLDLSPDGLRTSRAHTSYYFGLLKEEAGDFDGAVRYYRRVLAQDPSAIGLANRAAYIAAQDGKADVGLEILTGSLAQNPENPASYLALSRFYSSYTDDGDRAKSESIRIAQEALDRFPNDSDIIEHMILTQVGFGEKEKAEAVLEKALASGSREAGYWLRMGRVAQHVWPMPERSQGSPDRINAIYRKARDLAPDDLEIAEAVGDYFNASGQFEEAVEIYRTIIAKDPDCITPREKLGRIYDVTQEVDKVIEVLSELLEIHPDRPNTQRFLGRIYEKQKEDYARAIDHYERSLRLARGEVIDYLHTAALMLLPPPINRRKDAVDLLERARFHYPENGSITRLLGIAYAFNEKYQEAIDAFEETVRLGAQAGAPFLDHELYFRYGACEERLKHYDKAAELFRKAITLVPEDRPTEAAKIYNYLGYMWIERDTNIDEAGELIIKANELVPDDGPFIDSLGWFHFKKKRYEEALKHLLRAEELLGDEYADAVILDHIAQTHFALGNHEEAIAYGEKSVAKAQSALAENEGVELDVDVKELEKRLEEFRAALKPGPAAAEKPDAPK